MNKKIITVPSGTKYLSEIISDLPHNAYINKGLTGIGGTTIALTNDEYYVVAVHTLALVENKMQQHNHVLGVLGRPLIMKYRNMLLMVVKNNCYLRFFM